MGVKENTMSTLQQLRSGLGRAWDHIAEGWRQLSERATQSLTHFNPVHHGSSDVEVRDALVERSASRWALLAADVMETADEVVVNLEAPGLEPGDFEIHVEDNALVIRGEKHLQRESREGRYHVLECAYGAFERAIALPSMVDEGRASAQYRNGILRVALPKRAAHHGGRIQVNVE
jgi:HSP20 family protein